MRQRRRHSWAESSEDAKSQLIAIAVNVRATRKRPDPAMVAELAAFRPSPIKTIAGKGITILDTIVSLPHHSSPRKHAKKRKIKNTYQYLAHMEELNQRFKELGSEIDPVGVMTEIIDDLIWLAQDQMKRLELKDRGHE